MHPARNWRPRSRPIRVRWRVWARRTGGGWLRAPRRSSSWLPASVDGTSTNRRRVEWARSEGLPEIARLLAEGKGLAAFDLAQQVGALIPNDPEFQQTWAEAVPRRW